MVRLRDLPANVFNELYLDFNSSVVRLRVWLFEQALQCKSFQFLGGAIKRLSEIIYSESLK